jgi:hypothetical protein
MKLSVIALLTGVLGLVGCGDDETSGTGGSGATGGTGGSGGTGGTGGVEPPPRGCDALEGEQMSTSSVICQVEVAPDTEVPLEVLFNLYATTLSQDLIVGESVDMTTCVDIILDPSLAPLIIGLMAEITETSMTLSVSNADPGEINHTIPDLPTPVTEVMSTDEVTGGQSALDVGDVVVVPATAVLTLFVPMIGEIGIEVGQGDCTAFEPVGDPITFQAVAGTGGSGGSGGMP